MSHIPRAQMRQATSTLWGSWLSFTTLPPPRYASLICVSWLIHTWSYDYMCNMTCSYVGTWHMCDMTRSRMGSDSSIRCLFFSITSLSPIRESPIYVDMILCVLLLTYLLDTTCSSMLLIFLYYITLSNSRLTHICRHDPICAVTPVSWKGHVTHIIIFSSITSLSPIRDSLIFVDMTMCVTRITWLPDVLLIHFYYITLPSTIYDSLIFVDMTIRVTWLTYPLDTTLSYMLPILLYYITTYEWQWCT